MRRRRLRNAIRRRRFITATVGIFETPAEIRIIHEIKGENVNTRKRKARCHTPDKILFHHEGEARRAATDAAAKYRYPMEAYECRSCGYWHITKVKR